MTNVCVVSLSSMCECSFIGFSTKILRAYPVSFTAACPFHCGVFGFTTSALLEDNINTNSFLVMRLHKDINTDIREG